eukprot:SM000049S16707  [mRNA]  locus=s49:261878:264222:+ [translate_table: standard]
MAIPCELLHAGQRCGPHFLAFLWPAFWRAIPVYLPVYLIPALLVHRRAVLYRPLPILSKVVFGAARSSFFLGTFCASAWLWTCVVHQISGRCNGPLLALGTFPAGLAVVLEKKTRRMELALYCLSRAAESFAICAADWPWLRGWLGGSKAPLPRADIALFCAATAVIMHCYAVERDVFRSKYLNVLDWVFGVPGLLDGVAYASGIHSEGVAMPMKRILSFTAVTYGPPQLLPLDPLDDGFGDRQWPLRSLGPAAKGEAEDL